VLRGVENGQPAGEQPAGEPARRRALRSWDPLTRALAAAGDHWTLTIALALAPGRMRLAQLHARLPGVSTGVFDRYIQQMVALGLVTRARFSEKPPRVELELTDAGRELLPIAGALARWGARHLWSAPREHELLDVATLLRVLPALLEGQSELPDGSIEALVLDTDPPTRARYRISDGRLQNDGETDGSSGDRGDGVPGEPDNRGSVAIRGDTDAWVAALGPANDRERLQITGEERLAQRLLDALHDPA
jgi:DNA-binding HxlR family transcriptional regulator